MLLAGLAVVVIVRAIMGKILIKLLGGAEGTKGRPQMKSLPFGPHCGIDTFDGIIYGVAQEVC